MSIPMTQDGVQPNDGREPAALLAIGPEAKARVRILVVDDEHTLRESCAAVLRHEGYDVTVCSRGQDGLDLLKRRAFDVVLVDLYMSQVDGLALLRAALGTNHDTIVIVMTGNPSVESSLEALRQGAFDYLPKPFSASHLQVLIGRAVPTLLVARETREQQDTLDLAAVRTDKLTLLGTARAYRRTLEPSRTLPPVDAPVSLTGERGGGQRLSAPRGQRDHRRRRERAVHRRDQRRPGRRRQGRRDAGGPVLPLARGADQRAGAARATRGHPTPGGLLPLHILGAPSPQGRTVPALDRRGAARAVRVRLARQRPRASERHRACGRGRGTGRRDPARGLASHRRLGDGGDGGESRVV